MFLHQKKTTTLTGFCFALAWPSCRHPSISHRTNHSNSVAIVIGQAIIDFQLKLQFLFFLEYDWNDGEI
jgi:hypothetical protein